MRSGWPRLTVRPKSLPSCTTIGPGMDADVGRRLSRGLPEPRRYGRVGRLPVGLEIGAASMALAIRSTAAAKICRLVAIFSRT
jgi:hypothetical protein